MRMASHCAWTWRSVPEKWPRIDTPVRNVVWAEVSDSVLEISFIARRRKKHALSLVHITGRIKDDQVQLATAFATSLLDAAYAGKRCFTSKSDHMTASQFPRGEAPPKAPSIRES